MASELILPRQGQSVESCIIVEWKKSVGDAVLKGEVVVEVETDKATFEVEATASGTLLAKYAEEGDDVPVLSVIAMIGTDGEEVPATPSAAGGGADAQGSAAPEPRQTAEAPQAPPSPASSGGATAANAPAAESGAVSPRARNMAAAYGLDPSTLFGSGPSGRVIERDVLKAVGDKAPATPAARAAMVEKGMTAPAVGTGVGGRVTTNDLTTSEGTEARTGAGAAAFAAALGGAAGRPGGVADLAFPGPTEEIAVKGVRKVIAERMHTSLSSTAQLTMHASADARKLLAWRKRYKAADDSLGVNGITINDLVLYSVSRTLPLFPELNAHFHGETIVRFSHVHLGFAVDTSRGLMVPTIRFADRLSLKEISTEAKRLSKACQEGTAAPDELGGATFTVTNLGSLGIEMFTPVLNPPQAAILGVCSIEPRPRLADGETVFIPSIGLSLTIDHQAVDGAPAGRFLKQLCDMTADLELAFAL